MFYIFLLNLHPQTQPNWKVKKLNYNIHMASYNLVRFDVSPTNVR